MKKILCKYGLGLALVMGASLATNTQLHAQAACGTDGETVGAAYENGPTSYAIGDLTVVDGGAISTNLADGDWLLGPSANVDVYAAITIPAGAIVRLKSGAVLNVYGNLTNNGELYVEAGATINFYGKTWTNGSSAIVGDGAASVNTTAGGAVNFIAARPTIPASLHATSCVMTNYSTADVAQNIDGGNVPMDIALHIKNANNVVLINTATKIEGSLSFDVDNGDVILNAQDLAFTTNGTVNSYGPLRMVVTGDAITGHVVKENYTGDFIYPVGIAEGDYTPASINNTTANTMHVSVQSYTNSASVEGAGTSGDGMQRTWNIFADNASGNSVVDLQHNSSTNNGTFDNASHFVTRFGSSTPNATGQTLLSTNAWQSNNLGAGTSSGALSQSPASITGASERAITNTTFATTASDNTAYYTKASNPVAPTPIELLNFEVTKQANSTLLNWSTATEHNNKGFHIERSADGRIWSKIDFVSSLATNGNSTAQLDYILVDKTPLMGDNFYRLQQVDFDGNTEYSQVRKVNFSISRTIEVYPNPAKDVVNLSNLTGKEQLMLVNAIGQTIHTQAATLGTNVINVSSVASGNYIVLVLEDGTILKQVKLVINRF